MVGLRRGSKTFPRVRGLSDSERRQHALDLGAPWLVLLRQLEVAAELRDRLVDREARFLGRHL